MTLIQAYEAAITRHDISDDPAQRVVLSHLQRVADDLAKPLPLLFKQWRGVPVTGLYLHGPVGVGKTYLVDLFYDEVSEPKKARFHFHHFMQQVDAELRRLQGTRDPLLRIAANVAKTTRLLCFDEFLVDDVADALILAALLQALLAKGVVLVISSNTAPDSLYLNGVQRDRFLPAIALIKQHCEIVAVAYHSDYRLGRSPLHQAYLCPLDERAAHALNEQFKTMALHAVEGEAISIQARLIPSVKCSEHAVWFRFDVICNLPRSPLDYLEIATRFDTVFVSDIPVLTAKDTTRVLLLIRFIDVMYDRGVRLVMSAAVPAAALYLKGEMLEMFQRTLSRLEEMQSEDYLRRHQRRQVRAL